MGCLSCGELTEYLDTPGAFVIIGVGKTHLKELVIRKA